MLKMKISTKIYNFLIKFYFSAKWHTSKNSLSLYFFYRGIFASMSFCGKKYNFVEILQFCWNFTIFCDISPFSICNPILSTIGMLITHSEAMLCSPNHPLVPNQFPTRGYATRGELVRHSWMIWWSLVVLLT